MTVFDIIKNQMIENEMNEKKLKELAESSFNNGATFIISNKYFDEKVSKFSHEWDYVLKCLIASDFNYKAS